MPTPYDAILYLDRPVSPKHPSMPRADRAAQFASFAALSGYEDAVRETARLTDERIVPDENAVAVIDRRLSYMRARIDTGEFPAATVTYFVSDVRKEGGSYRTVTVILRRIDEATGVLLATDHPPIPLADIMAIEIVDG